MGLDIEYDDAQTPLDEDEKEDLRITSITTRGELDEFEQKNIEDALQWLLKKKLNADDLLQEKFIRDLHRRMFGEVWKWAGEFRRTNKNIGVDKLQIPIMLRNLINDCKYWIEQKSFEADEIAIRFKHRLVSIHCFANGNGRHSRLMADLVIEHVLNKPPFSWGAANLVRKGQARNEYLKSLKAADQGDYALLLKFARS